MSPGSTRVRASLTAGALLVVLTSCASGSPTVGGDRLAPASPKPEPYPYTTPTPPLQATTVDGTWIRNVPQAAVGGAGKCRRCPPYRLAPGEDTLELHRGVFRVAHEGEYMAVGHYVVEGDRLTFFNDPNCSGERGTYAWTVQDGALHLEVVDDECAFGDVRVRFLTAAPWTGQD
jgi:hypothetical protein